MKFWKETGKEHQLSDLNGGQGEKNFVSDVFAVGQGDFCPVRADLAAVREVLLPVSAFERRSGEFERRSGVLDAGQEDFGGGQEA